MIFMVIMLLLHSKDCKAATQGSTDRKIALLVKPHIVYLGEVPSHMGDFKTDVAAESHLDMLVSVLGSHDAAEESLIYSYGKSFNGFAARLSVSEAQKLSNMHGVVSVFENRKKKLLTTRSWDFIGFPQSAQRNLQYESDVIVAMLDTGIRNLTKEYGQSQRVLMMQDSAPSHQNGKENAKPHPTSKPATSARIASYKVCWDNGCWDVDILAAFDDAIHDGVDIISLSLGFSSPLDYFEDSIAIGAFHAMKKGILTSNAGGNSGPGRGSIVNASPWSLTVAASSIDRHFHSELILGNNKSFKGVAINTFSIEKPSYPLIYGGDAPNTSTGAISDFASACFPTSLDRNKVRGKIVLCTYASDPAIGVIVADGVGVVSVLDLANDTAFLFSIPATLISSIQGEEVQSYIESTSSPMATLRKSDTANDLPAPAVASFSSRGPNPVTLSILKRDITAPGIDILAAWSKASSLSGLPWDKRIVDFNIVSGTSMSCPHVTGAAAYVKSFHPDWSSSAIKSALMTTDFSISYKVLIEDFICDAAYPLDANYDGNEDAELGYGSGQINPIKAVDPGLIYDVQANSYIDMLCSQGYNTTSLRLVTGDNSTCSNVSKNGVGELNYPSMMIFAEENKPISGKFPRTVTNVGSPQSTYKAVVNTPSGMNTTVEPNTLSFTSLNQTLLFTLTVNGGPIVVDTAISGALTWSSGSYSVRSPIVIYCNSTQH
eukprot:Gb_37571 [translate_table: standard]